MVLAAVGVGPLGLPGINLSGSAAARWFSVYIVAGCMRPDPRLDLLRLEELPDLSSILIILLSFERRRPVYPQRL